MKGKRSGMARGFTLIELLVVIVIISILTGLLMANFVGIRQRGRDAQRKSDLRQLQSALEFYRSDHGYYPCTPTSCNLSNSLPNKLPCNSVLKSVDGSTIYLEKIPCEPLLSSTNIDYVYVPSPGSCNNTTIICTKYVLTACLENPNDSDIDKVRISTGCTSSPYNGTFNLNNP